VSLYRIQRVTPSVTVTGQEKLAQWIDSYHSSLKLRVFFPVCHSVFPFSCLSSLFAVMFVFIITWQPTLRQPFFFLADLDRSKRGTGEYNRT
jgi:hypothetical protein